MIERLLIQNFQSHGKLAVDFSPGITCIVGPSDTGKSAVLRALRWVCTNEPGGDAFVQHGAKGATVKLVVDGHTVARRRSPGGATNEYHLDGEEYKAFGRAVPQPIADLINLGPVCWQGQHDAPFWFADSPGEVSRSLNSIVNLGIIDDTLATVAKAVHRGRTKLELAEEALTKAKQAHDEAAWVQVFDKELQVVEGLYGDAYAASHRAADVADLAAKAQAHRATQANAAAAATAGQRAVAAGQAATEAHGRATALSGLVVRVRDASERVRPVPPTNDIEVAYTAHHTARKQGKALANLLATINEREEELCQAEKELKAAVAALPKVCPVCGRS